MYYSAIKKWDIADGVGVRVTIFVSGCTNHCPGCFQPETWDFQYGQPYTKETEQEILKALEPEFIQGLTLLGGEPMEIENQMVVDKNDAAFQNPTKPIGPFYTEEEAEILKKEKGYILKEDAGRGWRRVVASPIPRKIVEIDAIKDLWDSSIVISCGGGGIPVVENMDGTLEGVAAVIDKDFAAELLAEQVEADILMILTEVEKVAVNWNKADQKYLDHMNLNEAVQFIEEGHFAAGSMLPKVEAAMKFVRANPDKRAIITSLDKAIEALEGKTGTEITFA